MAPFIGTARAGLQHSAQAVDALWQLIEVVGVARGAGGSFAAMPTYVARVAWPSSFAAASCAILALP